MRTRAARRPFMRIERHTAIDAIDAGEWDALAGAAQPFLSHAFFASLERHGAVGGASGWRPHYLTAWRADRLVGAVPLFLKDHSFGEFVFDWAWAGAHHRLGIPYYPKLVATVPYTPVGGPRILLRRAGAEESGAADALIDAALGCASDLGVSSLHWLFTDEVDAERLRARGFMERNDCQFHWINAGYSSFDDFLGALSSRARKKVRAERAAVRAQGIRTEVLGGAAAGPETWDAFYRFYVSTFDRKGSEAPLARGFFHEIGARLGDSTRLILAYRGARLVAGAFFYEGGDVLYGRHWGCSEDIPGLHFELCYYRAIEHCIERGIACFEAGAQGEYKARRGFRPVRTRSMHWIAHAGLGAAIDDFLSRERRAVDEYIEDLVERQPFRRTHAEG